MRVDGDSTQFGRGHYRQCAEFLPLGDWAVSPVAEDQNMIILAAANGTESGRVASRMDIDLWAV